MDARTRWSALTHITKQAKILHKRVHTHDRRDQHTSLERLVAALPGIKAAAYDGDQRGPGGPSDPTGRAVGQVDVPTRDLARFDFLVNQAAQALTEANVILAGYGPARAANDADRLALTKANTRPEPGCESCARTEAAEGVPRWVPVDSRRKGPTTVGGRLPEPMELCSWCADKVGLWNRLPTVEEVELYHERGRVPWPKDVPGQQP